MKQREISGVHNSSLWNGFEFRDGDVIIATPPKTGTTLTQQIVGQLIFGGDPDLFARAVSPWIDAVQMPNAKQMAQAQTHRRFFKTHLPIDTLVYSPMAKYIFVGRDARDVAWALYNNVINLSDFAKDQVRMAENVSYNKYPEIIEYYRNFISGDSFWEHVGGWWSYRHLPNLMVLHFNNLISDRIGSIRQIADFLGIPLSAGLLDKVVEYTSIDHMKMLAAKDKGLEEQFIGGGKTFINKGINGRWQAVLSEDDIALCDTIAAKRLPPDCAHWLRTGELPNHR